MAEPQKTYPNPLLPLHQQADAEMQAYDAIEIVSTFGEPQAEYAAIHNRCAMMDLPHRGILEITGADRHAFLGNLLTNKTWDRDRKQPLSAGEGAYAFLLNLQGRVVLDVNVIETGERAYLETDVRLTELLRGVLDKYLFAEKVKLQSAVGRLHEIALHGPEAPAVLAAAGEVDVEAISKLPAGGSMSMTLFGAATTVWRDDVCGSAGLHLIVPTDLARIVWMNLISRFGAVGEGRRQLRQIGWAAFNAARIEQGRPIAGVDYELAPPSLPGKKKDVDPSDEPKGAGVLPAETGQFDRAVSVTKGCYLGQEIVARMHARNVVARKIIGFRMADDALPIAGSPVMDEAGNTVGVVTSSTPSPVLSNACIGLALVKRPHFEVGKRLQIPAEGAIRPADVVKLPFVNQDIREKTT